MKRCLLLALLWALLLTGCSLVYTPESTSQEETTEPTEETIPRAEMQLPEETARGFSEYLDSMLFLPGKQEELHEFVGQFEHNGLPISSEWRGTPFCGVGGGETIYDGDGYGATRKWYTNKITELGKYGKLLRYETEKKFYRFSTRVELEGFLMPFEIALHDEMAKVLEILGTDIDPLEVYGEKPGDQTELLLYESDRETVILRDHRKEEGWTVSFGIEYTECYEITREDGYPETVTRVVTLNFSEKSYELYSIRLQIEQYCEKR